MSDTAEPTVREHIERAIELRGSEAKLARDCGVTQPAIWKAKTTEKVSPELALAIHRATDGVVPASALRPDLWSRPEHVPSPSIVPEQSMPEQVSS